MVQDNAIKKAWEIFYDLQASGELDIHDCNTMLQACFDAAQMQKLVDVAVSKVDVEPNIVTYNMLIGMLRVEGDDEAAKKVVEEMKKAKVGPNEITKEMLNYPARGKYLGRLRTAKLAQLLKQGEDEATTAARSMMDKMVENGVADVHQFGLMLKFCTSSDEIRKVIDVAMPEAGVKPNAVTYSTLIGMLRVEGDDDAAKKVVEEMKKAKVRGEESWV
jgi:pentatricopeptide repeat protein